MPPTLWCCLSDCNKRGEVELLLYDVYCKQHALDLLRMKLYTITRENVALINQRNYIENKEESLEIPN